MIKRLTNVQKLIPVYNIVVFGGNSTLKDVTHSNDVFVITIYLLHYQIKMIESTLSKKLTPMEQARIVDALLYLNVEDNEKRMEHIQKLKSKYNL